RIHELHLPLGETEEGVGLDDFAVLTGSGNAVAEEYNGIAVADGVIGTDTCDASKQNGKKRWAMKAHLSSALRARSCRRLFPLPLARRVGWRSSFFPPPRRSLLFLRVGKGRRQVRRGPGATCGS